jgi:hypothetical protein
MGTVFRRLDVPKDRAVLLSSVANREAGLLGAYQTTYLNVTPEAIRRVVARYLVGPRRIIAEVVPVPTAPKGGRLVSGGPS